MARTADVVIVCGGIHGRSTGWGSTAWDNSPPPIARRSFTRAETEAA